MARLEAVGANAAQIEFWNGPTGEQWAKLADNQDNMHQALGLAAMDACDIRPGHTVLDVGCGSGATTIEIARRIGAEGRVLGIDISTPMLNIGRARLEALEIDVVTFDNKDVATYPFEERTFDRVFSRCGVMFFVDPIAAFANICSSMKSDGRLAFVCWQALNKNPWMEIPLKMALQYVSAPPPAGPEEPGPMALADPDRVRQILSGAGFENIKLEPLESKLPIETDVPTAAQKLMLIGPAGRLLRDAPESIKERAENDLREAFAKFQTENGVLVNSAAWIVRATAP